MNPLRITKAHGTGNDFVIIEDLDDSLDLDVNAVARICDRHFGVGADGLIRITASTADSTDFFMDYKNADGSIAEMCGNGIRCLTKFVVDRGHASPAIGGRAGDLLIGTRAGTRRVTYELASDGLVHRVEVDMGKPEFSRELIPMTGEAESGLEARIHVEELGKEFTLHGVSMGNPHAVIFGDDPDHIDVARIGYGIEHSSLFPDGVNVEFVKVLSRTSMKMRVWERGVGETLACGTGACAAFAAARELNLIEDSISLTLPGGELALRWDESIMMAGPAVEVFEAEIDLDSLTA